MVWKGSVELRVGTLNVESEKSKEKRGKGQVVTGWRGSSRETFQVREALSEGVLTWLA
jgi:hypothetical protein